MSRIGHNSRAGWTRTKELKHSLLTRAVEERGPEARHGMILLIQWRLAQETHLNRNGVKLLKAFEDANYGQPQAIRALNTLEERYPDQKAGNRPVRWFDNGGHTDSPPSRHSLN